MARSLPPLAWFRSFEAAARHLSFTAAADELSLTQSAVSQNVRSLEVRFGAQLFQRLPRGLALTDDGRKLLPTVGSAMEMLAQATETFTAGRTTDLITIATSVSIAQWILAPRIKEFLAEHKNVRVRLLSTIWPDDFKASIADVEIRFGSKKQVGAGASRLQPDELIAVSSRPLPNKLETHCLIEAVGTSEGWQKWSSLTDYGASLSPTLYVDSHGLALDLAMNGTGVALTSALLANDALSKGLLQKTHPKGIKNSEGYFVAVNSPSPAAKDFADWLLSITLRQ